MKSYQKLYAALALTFVFASTLPAQAKDTMSNPMVGGAAMVRTKDIVDNAVNSQDNTILVAAVKAAGLVDTLKGAGPFTVFAPSDEAFKALPSGTVDTLLKPANKTTLSSILTYHVIAGRLDFKALKNLINSQRGKATLTTVNGAQLTAMLNGPRNIVVVDDKGAVAHISTYDVYQSNGVIHVIDRVLMP
ncbi:MAG: fasciclin domain-containing protein [Candidatus Eremiobacteraeota bacterium]|nr:fasciclin domain-containing protein [Candidatus Eremiobacteraeota bacterium]